MAVGTVFCTASDSFAAVAPIPIQTEDGNYGFSPGATSTYLAWDGAPGDIGRVYAEVRGTTSYHRVASNSYSPSPIATTQQIIYQRTNKAHTLSDLYTNDLSTGTEKKLPKKVDSSAWEYYAVASTKFVFFMRLTPKYRKLLLYDRQLHTIMTLDQSKTSCTFCLHPTWVGQDYALYDKCSARTYACSIRVWNDGSISTLPRAAYPKTRYSGVMDEATGNVYFVESTVYCGIFVTIFRWNVAGGAPTDLYDTDEGIDLGSMSLAPNSNPANLDLLFEEYDCLASQTKLYEIDQIDLA